MQPRISRLILCALALLLAGLADWNAHPWVALALVAPLLLWLAWFPVREANPDAPAAPSNTDPEARSGPQVWTPDDADPEFLQGLLDRLPITLLVTDPHRFSVVCLNRFAQDELGITQGDARGRPVEEILGAQVFRLTQHAMRQAMASSEAVDQEFEWRRNGHPAIINARHYALRDPEGTPRLLVTLARDVTEGRHQAAELERVRHLAETASQTKSHFMASMTHEIRTPMNAILGMTELLLATPLDDKQRRLAQSVFRSGESLLEIINDILDFSRIEAGRLELTSADFPLSQLVGSVMESLGPRAHEKGLEISAEVGSGLPAFVRADPTRLQQVLNNLVSNAIKFTERGEVRLSVRYAAGQSIASASDLIGQTLTFEFTVQDTGIGIDRADMPRLFDAFTQVQSGLSRRYGGTGLGLAITGQLVALMHGEIDVDSAPGQGSRFTFRVPLVVAPAPDSPGASDELQTPLLSVLIVHENLAQLTVLDNILSGWGLSVSRARQARHAIDMVAAAGESAPFDILLVDMALPGIDGLSLLEELHSRGLPGQTRTVLLGIPIGDAALARASVCGIDRMIASPVQKGELRRTIASLAGEKASVAAQQATLGLRVLLVEDNPVNQEVCSLMLLRLGCQVHTAGSGLEGLKRLCEDTYDMVLMDIQMPGMDGVEALSQFRHNLHGRYRFRTPATTPVLAITANTLDGDEERYLSLGFNAYLSKPFRIQQLQQLLQTWRPEVGAIEAEGGGADAPAADPVEAGPVWRDVFDPASVERLLELDPGGQNQLLERVTKMFAASLDKYMGQLEHTWQAGDLKTVRDVAHTLKSSSANVGALKLSQCCVDIETSVRDRGGDELGPLIGTLKAEGQRVLDALPSLLQSRA